MLLPLKNSEKSVLVDDFMGSQLGQFAWTLQANGYAVRYENVRGKTKAVYLHRELVGPGPGFQVDHVNGDRLDCRYANLRLATASQNQHNRKTPVTNTSGHKGVHKQKNRPGWTAQVKLGGKTVWSKYFRDFDEACRQVDAARERLHGEYVRHV